MAAQAVPLGGPAAADAWSFANWSGYAETGDFTGVTSTWSVPAVSPTPTPTYSDAWIGIDGFNDSNLIQTGTGQDWYGGAAHYFAWWEILPLPTIPITVQPSVRPVAPGDEMDASIYETSAMLGSAHWWVVQIADVTEGWNFTIHLPYAGPQASAEWIVEAPTHLLGVTNLAHYTFSPPAGTGDFANAGVLTTVVPARSSPPTFTDASLNFATDAGVMIQHGQQVSTPSAPGSDLDSFNVAYGPDQPPAPPG